MNLNSLKKFAQGARRTLLAEVASRLDYVLGHDDAYVRSHQGEIGEIRRQLEKKSREQLVEEVAYTWFNRVVALRYMDLRGYHKVRIVSPQAGQVQPELLFQIKQGRTPPEIRSLQTVFDGYLSGTLGSTQPDREIYTTALLGICNDYSRTLPFLFRQVDAYMAVLLPTDLLSESSILSAVQGAIGEEDVTDVEVIGWLYQFYISEKKDQVFGRPKGEKIKKEDIPAATQLFTPHWIVRYMVENSLGRLWRNNRPDTALAEQMEYYIEGDPEPEHLTIEGPEEITLLDPACGSGHILTYAFDLLYGMYEEAGYSAEEIPSLILTNNLYGIDIDTRAAELASFALTMKAREKDRFFFKRGVVPRVVAMEDVTVDLREAGITMSPQLQEAFGYLTEATNFGSLIPVPAEVQGEIEDILAELDAKGDADLFADQAMAQVRSGLRQLGYLARRYHCVVTNPPYFDPDNGTSILKQFVRSTYGIAKADLFSCFIVASSNLLVDKACLSMITQHNWMFIPKFKKLRPYLLQHHRILNLVHLGPRAFESIGGEVVQSVAFVLRKTSASTVNSVFVDLTSAMDHAAKQESFLSHGNEKSLHQSLFNAVPDAILCYWLPEPIIRRISEGRKLSELPMSAGIMTTDNDLFVRYWFEVSAKGVVDPNTTFSANGFSPKWFFLNKGGGSDRWYGLNLYVVNWAEDGREIKQSVIDKYPYLKGNYSFVIRGTDLFFKGGITWSALSSKRLSARESVPNAIMATVGPIVVPSQREHPVILGLLNSRVAEFIAGALTPTQHFDIGPVGQIPYPEQVPAEKVTEAVTEMVSVARRAWDCHETSWDFSRSLLLIDEFEISKGFENRSAINRIDIGANGLQRQRLSAAFDNYAIAASSSFAKLHALEERNNRIFIDSYGLSDLLSPEVPFSEISIFRDELDAKALDRGELVIDKAEVLRQFVSYGVGCIFGRYSLDKDGLILANAGNDLDAYLSQIPEPTIPPDESGILPITDDNDFADDLPSQWRAFLRAAFGDEHYEENLRFLEDGLGKRLRPYFLKGFYDDHVKRYKKRPIYWLITSPNGTLQALIYLHRYNRDAVNRFLNDYLRPYQQKLEAKRVSAEHVLTGGGSSQSEKTKAQKRIDEIRKALEELSTWERDVVRPLAEKRIELDLDDGVKVNYGKLGAILAKVKGLNA